MSNTDMPETSYCAIHPHTHKPLRFSHHYLGRTWECACDDCGQDYDDEGNAMYAVGEGDTAQDALEDYAERSGVELALITHVGEKHV
jgi:hypothetical protein